MTQWRLTWRELKELPFIDWNEMANAAMRERGREARAARMDAAFTAWLMGAGEKKTWNEFCCYYGLIEKQSRPKEARQMEIKRAYDVVNSVLAGINKGGS